MVQQSCILNVPQPQKEKASTMRRKRKRRGKKKSNQEIERDILYRRGQRVRRGSSQAEQRERARIKGEANCIESKLRGREGGGCIIPRATNLFSFPRGDDGDSNSNNKKPKQRMHVE